MRNRVGIGSRPLVRTTCCESYKVTGERCSVCPNRLENQVFVQIAIPPATSASGSATRRPFRSCFRQPEELPEMAAVLGD